MKSMITACSIVLAGTFLHTISFADSSKTNPVDAREYLKQFHANPKKTMNTPLALLDENGKVAKVRSPFAEAGISREEMWKARDEVREKICAMSRESCSPTKTSRFSAISDLNSVKRFLIEPDFITKLSEMETRGLTHAQAPRAPWSDSFWPMSKGVIARRWLDRGFPDSKTFIDNYNYYLSAPPETANLDSVSPAEKYDFLVGDGAFRLTNNNWAQGKNMWDRLGNVPGWQGICHGWAAAAMMDPAPKKAVNVQGANGTFITFYPSDIKALTSAAWATSPPRTYIAGSRCLVPRPKEDANGRVLDESCFDVNPGAWHISVVNEMGVNKRSFIADTQYDYQIWNYPIYSYRYTYFNPQTLETSETMSSAVVKRSDFAIDKFKSYRNPLAKFMVGVVMEISYSIETSPSTRPVQKPLLRTQKFLYDVELDQTGAVVGGEWYSNFHPDFIWHFAPDSRPRADVEKSLSVPPVWDAHAPFPEEYKGLAVTASGRSQPLNVVVEALVRLSQE